MKSSTPASLAMVAAVRGLSPVIMTVRMPMRRNSSKRSTSPSLTVSLSSMSPRTRPSRRIASGVAPRSEIEVGLRRGSRAACAPSRPAPMASTAPLRIDRPVGRADAARARLGREGDAPRRSWPPVARSPRRRRRHRALRARPRRRRASSTIERPSGVSSRIDATSAAVTASVSSTPGAGDDRWPPAGCRR